MGQKAIFFQNINVIKTLICIGLTLVTLMTVSACNPVAKNLSGVFSPKLPHLPKSQKHIRIQKHPLILAKYGGEYRSKKVERMLAFIIGKLVAVSGDPSRVYRVTLLDSPKVNAFALPGSYLYITRGLLALANDSAELAAVIAHEMAHVSANHAILRQEKLASTAFGEKVAMEVLGDSPTTRIALAANRLKFSEFSREQELQADATGIRMIGEAGYDSFAAARFLETLAAFRTIDHTELSTFDDSSFMTSHPSTPKRIRLARKHARFFGAPGIGKIDRKRFLKGIEGLVFGDSPERGVVQSRRFSHSGMGITFTVPTGMRIENQNKMVVITGKNNVVVRFDAVRIGGESDPESYLNSGWINGLDPSSIKKSMINDLHTASANATMDGWNFRIHTVCLGEWMYRFIATTPKSDSKKKNQSVKIILQKTIRTITESFRALTRNELNNLTALKIRTVKFRKGDSLKILAEKIKTGGNKLKLLQALNGLKPDETPPDGYDLKIVSD